jgi:hypothetical protein
MTYEGFREMFEAPATEKLMKKKILLKMIYQISALVKRILQLVRSTFLETQKVDFLFTGKSKNLSSMQGPVFLQSFEALEQQGVKGHSI